MSGHAKVTLLVVGNKADRSRYYQYSSLILASMLGYVSCGGLHNIAFVVQLHFNELRCDDMEI